jgi:hypothetical protein
MPSPGTNAEQIPGKFTFVCEDYTETLKFTKVAGSARNRGGANEQFVGAILYEQQIHRYDGDKALIHIENGMYLNMQPVYLHTATAETIKEDNGLPEMKVGDGARGPYFIPAQTICRSGTIPHGSTINLIGKPTQNSKATPDPDDPFWSFRFPGAPQWPHGEATWPKRGSPERYHMAISDSMGGGPNQPINLDEPAPPAVTDPCAFHNDPESNLSYTQRMITHPLYPCSVRPDLRLRDATAHQNITNYVTFNLDTLQVSDPSQGLGGPQGGVLNIPFVTRFTPVRRARVQMWIETVKEGDEEFLQLQYEQVCTFEFGFGTDGGTTVWPHIQVNTLRKQK